MASSPRGAYEYAPDGKTFVAAGPRVSIRRALRREAAWHAAASAERVTIGKPGQIPLDPICLANYPADRDVGFHGPMQATAGEDVMGMFRLYSGDDGESHIEELDLASQPDLTTLHGAKGVG